MSKQFPELFVCGFLFNREFTEVVVVQKNGHWIGVGGHIEDGEDPVVAMQREFWEETGVTFFSWKKFCTLEVDSFKRRIHFYYGVADNEKLGEVRTTTDEQVFRISVLGLLSGAYESLPLWNVPWLTSMALSIAKGQDPCNEYRIFEAVDRR